MESVWRMRRRPGAPPISRLLVELNGRPFVVSDRKARTELGYQQVISRDEGIARLRGASAVNRLGCEDIQSTDDGRDHATK